MTNPEEERYTESEVMPVTRKQSGGETEDVHEAAYKGKTSVDEVVGKFIKRSKSYNISFQLGFSYNMKK